MRPPRLPLLRRSICTTPRILNAPPPPANARPQPQREASDVLSLTSLLSSVRNRSDPAHRSLFPMRSPRPWLETLLPPGTPRQPPTAETKEGGREGKVRAEEGEELQARRMHDSYVEMTLPILSQPGLIEQYTNVAGGIRNGKLMESLDYLAGSAAYKHMLGPRVDALIGAHDKLTHEIDFYLVTAAVERMDMLHYITASDLHDLRLSGNVIYTGRSSMEVTLQMVGLPRTSHEKEVPIMLGRFTMVCRDAVTHGARAVNQLVLSTPEEEALYALGKSHADSRKSTLLSSLSRVPPSKAEAELVHHMFLSRRPPLGEEFLSATSIPPRREPEDGVGLGGLVGGKSEVVKERGREGKEEWEWMEDTVLESCQVMFPQDRNVHGKVFGGYLMKLAYELAFATASHHTARRTLPFLSLDSISFKLPVPVGSLLKLKAGVGYADDEVVHIGVRANVLDVSTGEEKTTNEFWFTWSAGGEEGTGKAVVPRTYEEAMTWLESRRRLDLGKEIRAFRGKGAMTAHN